MTSKWSGLDNKGVDASLEESLSKLQRKSLDLYLIHSPRLLALDPNAWAKFVDAKKAGLVKSIGVSNYKIEHLEEIRLSGLEMPVVNQILLHPYVLTETLELLAYHKLHNIVTEAYSTLYPITHAAGGPVDAPVKKIAKRAGVTDGEVLLAWARTKGAVVLTSSRSKERLETYQRAGELVLTVAEIISIDVAGAQGIKKSCSFKSPLAIATGLTLISGAVIGYFTYF